MSPAELRRSGAVVRLSSDGGAATLTSDEAGWEIDLGELPDDAGRALEIGYERLAQGVDRVAELGGGRLRLWARRSDEQAASCALSVGMTQVRELYEMRRPLPVDEPWRLDVRAFRVGEDEPAWLAVNNRAFAWHPEQGGMTLERLRALEDEPWFDPAGFLVHEVDGELVGFCWTKVHADTSPPLGEIFVIAVDPAAHQRGLGRQLVLAGLDHLHRAGLRTGMLYTEADNEPALKLYRNLGFTVHSTDRAFDLDVAGR